MMNQKTPEPRQHATEEQIEAAARALFEQDNSKRVFAELAWVEVRSEYRAAARVALSASVSADPADEHHDAEERQAESPSPGKRLDPDFRATLVDFAAASIRDVWADVPEGVDAETLAQNVVAAQEFAWISRGFPVRQAECEDHAATVTPIMRCSDGLCPSGCSHLMWSCSNCSCEGGWGAGREKLEVIAAAHVCPEPHGATVPGDREQLIAEARDWARYDVTGASKIVIALCDALDIPEDHAATVPGDRENLILNYCPEHGDLLNRVGDGADARSHRCRAAHHIDEIAAALTAPVEVDK